MYYLLSVDIFQCVADVADDLSCKRLVYLSASDEAFKRTTVDPLHNDAVPDGRKIDHTEILAYT